MMTKGEKVLTVVLLWTTIFCIILIILFISGCSASTNLRTDSFLGEASSTSHDVEPNILETDLDISVQAVLLNINHYIVWGEEQVFIQVCVKHGGLEICDKLFCTVQECTDGQQ